MMMTKFLMMMMVENRLLLLWQLLLVLLLFLVVDVDVDFIAIAVVVVVVYFWISAYSVFSFSTVTVAPPSDMADLSRSAYTMSSLLSSVSPSFLSSPSFNSSDSAPPLPPDFLEATVFFIADSRLVTLAETDFLGSGLLSSVASGFPSTASVASADSVSPSSFSTAFSLSSSSALCLGTAKQRSPWDRATTKTATTTMMTRMMMTTAMTGPVPASPSVFLVRILSFHARVDRGLLASGQLEVDLDLAVLVLHSQCVDLFLAEHLSLNFEDGEDGGVLLCI